MENVTSEAESLKKGISNLEKRLELANDEKLRAQHDEFIQVYMIFRDEFICTPNNYGGRYADRRCDEG